LLLLCLVLGALAQTRVQKSIIDDYLAETPVLVIAITSTTTLPFQIFATTTDSGILGGERDLVLRANTGSSGRVFNSGVSEGQWNVATPNGASGISSTQYDGVDGSDALDVTGLGGVDLTTSSVDSFKLTIQTDIATTYVIDITDMSGGSSTRTIDIPAAPGVANDYYITFSSFTGNADFTKTGSVVLTIQGFDNVDTLVNIFSLAAPDTTPPPPPGVTPSPSPIPGDTWYRFDDDDDGKSPCGEEADEQTVFLADYNIIYYYFYGFQRPYIYVSNPNNSATLLIPSIFACILAFFAL
jgi:hypothetical protein